MKSYSLIPDGNDVSAMRQAYVDALKVSGRIRSAHIEAAFRAIPRHFFLSKEPLKDVYSDKGFGLQLMDGSKVGYAAQPHGVAEFLERLAIRPGQRVMVIGAGSGYDSALIAHIVGEMGRVIAIDIEEELVDIIENGFQAAGLTWAQAICGDGALGYSEGAPYEWILMTTGVYDIAPAWCEQLKQGGRMYVPLQLRAHIQRFIEFEASETCLQGISRQRTKCSPMRGTLGTPVDTFKINPESELAVYTDNRSTNDVAKSVNKLLEGSRKDWPTGIRVTQQDLENLTLWLAVREPEFCQIWGGGEVATTGFLPCLKVYTGFWKGGDTCGLLREEALSVLMYPPDQEPYVIGQDDTPPFELFVRSFGQDDCLAHRLVDQIIAWDNAARPLDEDLLQVRVYPKNADYTPSIDEWVIEKQWTRLVINWP